MAQICARICAHTHTHTTNTCVRAAFGPKTHTHSGPHTHILAHKRIQNKRQKLLFIARGQAFGHVFSQANAHCNIFGWQHFVNFLIAIIPCILFWPWEPWHNYLYTSSKAHADVTK